MFMIVLFLACAGEKMSVKEAKKVSVIMDKESLVPPPRRIDDILSVLDQSGNFHPKTVRKIIANANEEPPMTNNPVTLGRFYDKRAVNAFQLGLYKQQLKDLRKALSYAEKEPGKRRNYYSSIDYNNLLFNLAIAEARYGNFTLGISYMGKSAKARQSIQSASAGSIPRSLKYWLLAEFYLDIGDFQTAEKFIKKGIQICTQIANDSQIRGSGGIRYKDYFKIDEARLNATLLEARGQYAEAEPHIRTLLDKVESRFKHRLPFVYIQARTWLAKNLASQGRFIDAELEARKAIEAAMGLGGKGSGTTGEIIQSLGYILLLQGRVDEAEKVLNTGIRLLQASGLSYDSTILIDSILKVCTVYVADQNFTVAIQQYDQVMQAAQENHFYYQKNIERNPDIMFLLIKAGRIDQALPFISKALENYGTFFGADHPLTAELIALRAMIHATKGDKQNALNDFSKAIPILVKERTEIENNFPKKMRFRFIVEEYLKLLGDIYKANQEEQFKVNASAESFKLVQVLIESSANKALGATSARAASVHPDLSDLVRKEQDSLKQIAALKATVQNALLVSPEQQNPDALQELKDRIRSLTRARSAFVDEIKRRFPKYSDFTNPQPIPFAKIQEHLHSSEAMLTVFPTSEHTYVWFIPSSGPISFNKLNMGKNDVQKIVVDLRKALDPKPKTFGDIPDFNLELAYYLYRQLLEPVEVDWDTIDDLIIIASGPFGQLPFSVLPTKQVSLDKNRSELFSNYREIPWLIRDVSITRQPSVSAFAMLRELPKGDPHRKAFVGFGDPIFNKVQLAMVSMPAKSKKSALSIRQEPLKVRGIRISEKGNLDNNKIVSIQLEDLKRLPETSDEIKSIAAVFSADPDQDIFLGVRASENRIKTMDLSDRRIIVFASHALIPGDLDGLSEPAIALCSPSVTGEDEDGLLTMGEVLKLKLNADWVVLSSCNSGGSDGQGAEALSGLGQAFFYAGTKALLASMWPVESTSAQKLTTGLFRYQKDNNKLTRARALRKSILDLIDSSGLKDDATGKIVASYAHPLFWAPFILVGDNGIDVN
jgi:CHAT domain-containing protein